MHRITMLTLLLLFIQPQLNAQDKIYWSETSYNKIMRSNTDGTNVEDVLSGSNPGDVVLDTLTQKLYWSDYGTGTLRTASVDGSGQQVLVSGLNYPTGLAIDFATGQIYFTEYEGGRIIRCNLDGSAVTTLLSGLKYPYDVALHPTSGLMYWTERIDGKIYKAQLNGSGKAQLLTGLGYPDEIHVEPTGGHLYWQQSTGALPGSGVFRSNLDGTSKATVINQFTEGFAIDQPGNRILWTSSIDKTLYRSTLSGTGKTNLFQSSGVMGTPGAVVCDWSKSTVYWLDYFISDYLIKANLDGTSRKVLASQQVYRPTSFVVDTTTSEVYWVNSQSSYQADKAGAVMKGKAQNTDIQQLVPSNGKQMYAFVLDVVNAKMYWTITFPTEIMSSNLDGTNVSSLISADLGSIVGLSLDVPSGKIYWIDQSKKRIERANLDGSGREVLLTTNINIPYTLKLDLKNGKMYWTDGGDTKNLRANLDGTNVETIVSNDLIFPRDLALDPAAGKLYWADAGYRTINRANLDGTQATIVTTTPLYTQPTGLFLVKKASSPVREASVADLLAMPNPATDQVLVQHTEIPDRVVMYDMSGATVLEKQADALTTLLDISTLQAGSYQVVTFSKSRPVAAGQVVKL